ncbi:hypothetical protein [Phaffia rhodozyma]|uniref:RxLR-like protein n=1 Tax=Phaffia rhodozyma TaxID=264483 RepID=A0A0F7SVV2_PHARH|nr:hypothetical protein [Phaffia rhodozyma]
MAPILHSFNQNKRSVLSTLFLLTFLGSVATVAIPCPSASRSGAQLDSELSHGLGVGSNSSRVRSGSNRTGQESWEERVVEARRLARLKHGFLEER